MGLLGDTFWFDLTTVGAFMKDAIPAAKEFIEIATMIKNAIKKQEDPNSVQESDVAMEEGTQQATVANDFIVIIVSPNAKDIAKMELEKAVEFNKSK